MGRFVSSAILNAPALISLDWCNWVLFTALTRNWIGIFLLKIVAQEADHWKHWPFISVWNQVLAHPVSALLFSSCLLSQWLLLALVIVVSTFHSSHIKVAQTEDGDAFIFSSSDLQIESSSLTWHWRRVSPTQGRYHTEKSVSLSCWIILWISFIGWLSLWDYRRAENSPSWNRLYFLSCSPSFLLCRSHWASATQIFNSFFLLPALPPPPSLCCSQTVCS